MQVYEWLNTKLGQDIWEKKYRFNNETFDQWLDRVSGGNQNVKQLILNKQFLFGGRILANRGLKNKNIKGTLSNCYVLPSPEDNIESIFDCAKSLARTYSYGGGVGIDISKLAPRGAKVNNSAKTTTGSVSFMDLYSLVTELICQQGRRGALMISLSCSHPDLEEFIDIKNDLNKVTKANISIKIIDKFMEAVINNKEWELFFARKETGEEIKKIINAPQLFKKIAQSNWTMGEPGVLFWDRITSWSLLSEDPNFSYECVNPCGEQPLPAGGSCNLGAINLSEFVINPFTSQAEFDYQKFKEVVQQAVIAMNEVLDEGIELHPLQIQRDSVRNWRQIGIGIMGLADCLIKLGIKYGSTKSIDLCDKIGFIMIDTAIRQSALLAKEYGTYPMYNEKAIFESEFFQTNTTDETQRIVKKYGLRNSQLLTIAPTGSISTMLGVSGGLEPIYNISYIRKTESLHNEDKYYTVYTPIVKEYMEFTGITEEQLPEYFVTAMTLDYKDRIEMQSIWQSHIDASISSTVNVPESFTVEQVEDLYKLAWRKGLKGITLYRDNCERKGILTNTTNKQEKESKENTLEWGTTIQASDDLIGKKRKVMSGCGSVHVQAWFDPVNGKLTEIYLSKGSTGGCNSWMISNSRTMSAGLRTGMSFDYLIDQLKSAPTCASYAVRTATKKDTSKGNCCPAAVANALIEMQQEVFDELGIYEDIPNNQQATNQKRNNQSNVNITTSKCPECGEELQFIGGCSQCQSCGWSRCG